MSGPPGHEVGQGRPTRIGVVADDDAVVVTGDNRDDLLAHAPRIGLAGTAEDLAEGRLLVDSNRLAVMFHAGVPGGAGITYQTHHQPIGKVAGPCPGGIQ
jgi:hypothetical protein